MPWLSKSDKIQELREVIYETMSSLIPLPKSSFMEGDKGIKTCISCLVMELHSMFIPYHSAEDLEQ